MKTPALCALLAAGAAAHSLRSGSSALLHPQADAALVGAPDAPLRPDAALVGAPGLPSGVPDVVTVDGGAISGVRAVAANLRYWLGVPYAATTGGDNAWRAPQPRSPWSGTLDASTWGPGCLQPHHNPDCPANQSFDCLNVNVYAPAALPPGTTSLPVMVFIHGGAWLEGSNQGPFYIYAGSYVAANESMVVVTVNYRLSAWGFAALGADATEPVRGNFGLLDQRAALQWVQRNAPAFGGDPTRVTVWGESAGAMSIGIHMGSPGSRGLFSRAIMESNPAGFNYKNASEAAVYGTTFCANLNCTAGGSPTGACNVSCLRAAAAATGVSGGPGAVMDAWDSATGNVGDFIITDLPHILDGLLGTGPVVDGDVLFGEPQVVIGDGAAWAPAAGVSVLLGSNTGEGETFIYDGVPELPSFLAPLGYLAVFGFNETLAQAIDARPDYHSASVSDARTVLSHVVTDYWFRCASERFAAAAVAAGARAYVYRYAHLYSNASIFPTFGLPPICAQVVCHASELPFSFHRTPDFTTFSPAEDALSAAMVHYWAAFARGGDPNSAGGVPANWPAWDPVGRTVLLLNATATVESSADVCGWWDSVAQGYLF